MRKDASEADFTRAADSARRQINARKDVAGTKLKEGKKPKTPVKPQEIRVGDNVKVTSIGAKGSVLSAPDSKGMVSVQAGIMKLNVHYTELELQNETAVKASRKAGKVDIVKKMLPLSINLIGKTVDEALIEANKYLDDAFICGFNEVTIIHGKGTGALSGAIRDMCRRHPQVKSYRAGRFGEGEGGVTVVELKR